MSNFKTRNIKNNKTQSYKKFLGGKKVELYRMLVPFSFNWPRLNFQCTASDIILRSVLCQCGSTINFCWICEVEKRRSLNNSLIWMDPTGTLKKSVPLFLIFEHQLEKLNYFNFLLSLRYNKSSWNLHALRKFL